MLRLATTLRESVKALFIRANLFTFYFKNVEGVTNSGFSKKKLDLLDCEMNCKRARFTLLTQMYMNGYDHNDPYMRETKATFKKRKSEHHFSI